MDVDKADLEAGASADTSANAPSESLALYSVGQQLRPTGTILLRLRLAGDDESLFTAIASAVNQIKASADRFTSGYLKNNFHHLESWSKQEHRILLRRAAAQLGTAVDGDPSFRQIMYAIDYALGLASIAFAINSKFSAIKAKFAEANDRLKPEFSEALQGILADLNEFTSKNAAWAAEFHGDLRLRAIDEVHWVNSGGVRSANAHQTSTDDVREMGGKEETDIEELPDIGGGKSRALFELLMCNPGGCSLEELNAAIWDGDVLLPSIRRTIDRLNKNLRLKGSSFMVVQDEKTKNFSLQGMRSDKHGQTLRQSCPT